MSYPQLNNPDKLIDELTIAFKLSESHTICTIGHSTRDLDEFIAMLQSFDIETLVDVRSFPGSRKYPQFNKENLEESIPQSGINYLHLLGLGGRRKVNKNSKNTRWQNASFRAYADYMETEDFEKAVTGLEEIAKSSRTAIMCSEAVWWRCHRSMISDYLKAKGWTVLHIMGLNKSEEHPYTQPAQVVGKDVFYCDLDS